MYKMYLIYFFLEDHSTIFPKLFLKVFIRDNKKTPQIHLFFAYNFLQERRIWLDLGAATFGQTGAA